MLPRGRAGKSPESPFAAACASEPPGFPQCHLQAQIYELIINAGSQVTLLTNTLNGHLQL